MSPPSKVGVASLIALTLSGLSAAGAPPSEFAEHSGMWRLLEPLMFPALLGGVALTFMALVAAVVSAVRPASVWPSGSLCIAGCCVSMLGVTVATMIDAREGMMLQLGFVGALFAIPILGAAEAMRQGIGRNVGASESGGPG